MARTARSRRLGAAAGAVLATAALACGSVATAATASADDGPYTFAVIGDIPYGDAALAAFPANVAQIGADREVRFVAHLGDIKSGSSLCSDAYFATIRSDFDAFTKPLVYTPGDNEWTDCHRPNNGTYDPLERLAKVREVFVPAPGRTLGRATMKVRSQARAGIPENVSFERADVAFAAVHIVGSNNSLLPWTGRTAPTPEQVAEEKARTAAGIALVKETFRRARGEGDQAVVLMMQADMFDPTTPQVDLAFGAFRPVVQTIAAESLKYGKPVYLLNGDSHVFTDDNPLDGTKASPIGLAATWTSFYGVPAVPNLHRVTVDGSGNATDYLRVTVDEDATEPLSWVRVPFTG
ncbi:metallophosphoesterase family protein [Kineosporia sp. A_224]|uniref:metallophosphoesterase family protein n=1 Tax=Kineosporia sp. A_224 TaxID=1962180 RepID=UPI000B4BCB94|nr:metallophosphoesterase family protein [Kineosporia sp. A_224]